MFGGHRRCCAAGTQTKFGGRLGYAKWLRMPAAPDASGGVGSDIVALRIQAGPEMPDRPFSQTSMTERLCSTSAEVYIDGGRDDYPKRHGQFPRGGKLSVHFRTASCALHQDDVVLLLAGRRRFHLQRNRLADKVAQHRKVLAFFFQEQINHRLRSQDAELARIELP